MKTDVPGVALTPLIICIALVIASPGFIFSSMAWFSYYTGKRLTSSPGVPIASITREGRVKARGKAIPMKKGMKTPFFYLPCVWYASTISVLEIHYTSCEGGGETEELVWVPIRTEYSPESFYIIDPTGSVRVKPRGSKILVENERHVDSDRFLDGLWFVPDYIKRNNIDLPGNITDEDHYLRFSEIWIPSGDDVFVIGDAVRGSTENRPSQIPFTIKNIGKGMTITDVDYGKLPEENKSMFKGALIVAGIFIGVALAFLMIAALV